MSLQVSDVWRAFPPRHVLSGVSFDVGAGEIVGIIGPSGCGKSLLIKIIGQIVKADAGVVRFGGEEHFPVSLMFQEGALFDSLNVLDNVAFPLTNGKVPHVLLPHAERERVRATVFEALHRVGLEHAALKMPAQLSGGMRRRVSLARALVARPSVLLLDDPTCGLDPVASSVIMNLIGEIHREYRPTVLIVSHDLRRLFPLVLRVYALFDGRISFIGAPSEIAQRGDAVLQRFVSARYDLQHVDRVEAAVASREAKPVREIISQEDGRHG